MKTAIYLLIKAVLIVASLITVSVGQTQYYVGGTGASDGNDGQSLTVTGGHGPWLTLSHANSVASLGGSGTRVNVASGTYNGTLTLSKAGTSDNVRFEWRCSGQVSNAGLAATNWPCKLVGTGGIFQITGSWVNFAGFDYTSATGDTYALLFTGNHVHIQNNRIHDTNGVCTDNGGAGITVWTAGNTNSQSTDILITGNVIFNTSTGASTAGNRCHGMYIDASQVTVWNNVVYNNRAGYGIKYSPNTLTTGNSVISNNTLWGNGGVGAPAGTGGCIILGQDRLTQYPRNMTVNNNICYQNPGSSQGIGCYPQDADCSGSFAKNNLMSGNGSNAVMLNDPSTVTSAPQFVNFKADGSGDYHMKAGSPGGSATCGAGLNPCTPTSDFQGTAFSPLQIGAYALAGSTAVPPGPPTGLTVVVH